MIVASQVLGLLGCRSSDPPRAEAAASVAQLAVNDALGRRVALNGPARRIAALSPSNSEILFAVGCGPRVVLRDRASDYPVEVTRLPATNAFELSAEHVAGFRPDLVLVSHIDTRRAAALAAVGLTVAVFDPRSVAAVLDDIVAIATLCGERARAEGLVADIRARLKRVAARVRALPKPAVYVELDGSDPLKPWTMGSASFVHDTLRRAGGRNVFGALERAATQVGAEAIMRRAPQVIVLNVPPGRRQQARRGLVQRPGWARLPAVRDGRIIDDIDQALLMRPGPRLADGIEQLARLLHPVAFAAPTRR